MTNNFNPREYEDVHDRHCCQRHGCKYGDPDCTVVSGKYQGIKCEECYGEAIVTDIFSANMYLNWQMEGFGFGQLSVNQSKDGQITVDSECMGKEYVRKILYALADKIVAEGKFL